LRRRLAGVERQGALEVTWKNLHYYELDGSGNGSSNLAFGATLTESSQAVTLRVHRANIESFWGDPAPIAAGAWATLGLQAGGSAVAFSCQQPSAPPGSVFNHPP
jgi:hypothetical protein